MPFPNGMVDRITPATTDGDIEEVNQRFDVDDRWPVVCEPFIQWVLEDAFSLGRPPYEDAGVQVVADVEPYELMKLRLLNASHQAIAYFGYLCGYRLVHDAAQDPLFQDLLTRYMDDEATPTLAPVPGVDLDDYKRTLIERFSNPGVRDTIPRLCAESSDRIPKWLLPVVRAQLQSGGEITRSAAIVASWARYAEGSTRTASRSRSSTGAPTGSRRSRGASARIPTRSSPTATCSATSPTTSASPRPTGPRCAHCTNAAPRDARGARSRVIAKAGATTLGRMRAVVYEAFRQAPTVETVPDPAPPPHGAVVRVEASGLCRTDWHGWMGHDPDIRRFPHVPGTSWPAWSRPSAPTCGAGGPGIA